MTSTPTFVPKNDESQSLFSVSNAWYSPLNIPKSPPEPSESFGADPSSATSLSCEAALTKNKRWYLPYGDTVFQVSNSVRSFDIKYGGSPVFAGWFGAVPGRLMHPSASLICP